MALANTHIYKHCIHEWGKRDSVCALKLISISKPSLYVHWNGFNFKGTCTIPDSDSVWFSFFFFHQNIDILLLVMTKLSNENETERECQTPVCACVCSSESVFPIVIVAAGIAVAAMCILACFHVLGTFLKIVFLRLC